MLIRRADDLDAAAIIKVACGAPVDLAQELVEHLGQIRSQVESALTRSAPVYGVNTGLGAQSEIRLTAADQRRMQHALLAGRAVGGPPWLAERGARAVLATRLRTFLNGDAGVSPGLCLALVHQLNHGITPAIPTTGCGSAGEIIALAHAFATLTEPPPGAGGPVDLGAKEAIALLEGVPASTALAALAVVDVARLQRHAVLAVAGVLFVCNASRDPYRPELARGDSDLAEVLLEVSRAAGSVEIARTLQAPVSFRVAGPVLANVRRSSKLLGSAVDRALTGITDSPAFLPAQAEFVGTAGFHGIDLAAACAQLQAAVVHAAEMATAQLHRLLDPAVTGLPAQLARQPGPQAGLVAVHKRAVGLVHPMRTAAAPGFLGSMETSLGQEDLQSFSWQTALAVDQSLADWQQVLACQWLAVWHAVSLRRIESVPLGLAGMLDEISAVVPPITDDRPFGVDIEAIRALLGRPD